MQRAARLGTLAALLTLITSSLGAQAAERRTISGNAITVHNLVGEMIVEGTGGTGDVTVEVTRRGRDAGDLRIETGRRGEWQGLRIVYPERRIIYPEYRGRGRSSFSADDGWLDGDRGWGDRDRIEVRSSGDGLEAWADIRVMVPRGKRVSVRLGVGELRVSNVDGDLQVHAAAARATVRDIRGSLQVETGSGGSSITNVTGDVRVESGSGGAQIANVKGTVLEVSSGSGGVTARDIDVQELSAESGSGGARFTAVRARDVEVETGSGGTEIELLNDPGDVSVETGSGGVTLRLPANIGAELDVETGSGSIDSDFEVRVSRVERRALRGTIGDGRGRIRIETGSGRVRLLRGN